MKQNISIILFTNKLVTVEFSQFCLLVTNLQEMKQNTLVKKMIKMQ